MAKEVTQQQFDLLHELIVQRDLSKLTDERQRKFLSDPANIQRLNKDQASNAIGVLLRLPKLGETPKPTVTVSMGSEVLRVSPNPEVPAGRYYIVDPKDNVGKFFKVDKPTEGRWAGYTFVSVQASDDFYPIKAPNHRQAILEEIAKDPVESMRQYGLKIGVCGRCGITLTKGTSRRLGFGPICCEVLGIPYEDPGIELSNETLTGLLNHEGGE